MGIGPHRRSSVSSRPARTLRAVSLVLLIALAVVPMMTSSLALAAEGTKLKFPRELKLHGVLDGIPAEPNIKSAQVVAVDDVRRRLYVMYDDVSEGFGPATKTTLNTYDLRARGVPALLDSSVVSTGAEFGDIGEPYSTAYDSGRQHLLISRTGNTGARIDRVDLARRKKLEPFNLTTTVPGFSATGATYDAKDDRLYLLGEVTGTSAVGILLDFFGGAFRGGTAVVALDGRTGKVAWARAVPECQQPLVTFTIGSLIARSELRDALYFFCHPGGGASIASIVGQRNPGQSALVRLSIDPDGGLPEAHGARLDVFPVSGNYKNGSNLGISAFDPATDRFIVQSRAPTTPGAWVFDGRLEAWVGFITAPDDANAFIGLNPRTGRHYMAGPQYVNIADARLSPVPQGETISLAGSSDVSLSSARIALDPSSARLFLSRVGPQRQIAVVEDTTPLQTLEPALDFDALTMDVTPGPDSLVQYSAGTAGFGSNVRLAGGAAVGFSGIPGLLGEFLTTQGVGGVPPCVSAGVDEISCVSGGDREFTVGSVPSVDLRGSGTSAKAAAFQVDSNTDAERDGTRRAVRDRTDGDDDGVSSALGPAFGNVDCLDGGGDRQVKSTDHPFASAQVVCDLAKDSVTAMSSFGQLAGQPVGVSSSTFETQAVRDSKVGALTHSIAAAKGIRLGAPSGAHVSIANVTADAQTVAGGRPGTTRARWERKLTGITVRDGSGKEVLSAPGCSTVIDVVGGKKPVVTESGNCTQIIDAVNDLLKGRALLRLPQPEFEATPKGAYAAVNKSQRDYLQASTLQNDERKSIPAVEAIVLNDGEEKSRLVVQLAGVQANSIYTINNFEVPHLGDPVPNQGTGDVSQVDEVADAGSSGGTASADAGAADVAPVDESLEDSALTDDAVAVSALDDSAVPPVVTGPIVQRIAEGLRWLARSPGEAALVGGMWLLFGGALMATVRRLLLLRALQN